MYRYQKNNDNILYWTKWTLTQLQLQETRLSAVAEMLRDCIYLLHGKSKNPYFFLWVGPWGNHVENCIDRNSFWFFQNASLHIPIYLQQFLTQGHPKVKKSPFLFPPGYAPGAIRLKVASIERASDASKMSRRIYPSIFNSFRDIQRRIMSWPWNLG